MAGASDGIDSIVAGRKYISATLAEQLAADLDPSQSTRPAHETLNERQFKAFCKLALGRSNDSIASEICIGRKTVSTYRSQVFQRLNVRAQAGLMQFARALGWSSSAGESTARKRAGRV